MTSKWSVLAGILSGFVLALPLSYALINWKSEHRGVEVNEWRVSFRTGNFGNNYLLRAAIAVNSLGNAVPEEAMFFHGFNDGGGVPLNGANRYEVVFPPGELPPVDAFWSLTSYDAANGFLIKNPINRYNISDRTDGVKLSDDGSLRFILSVDEPESGKSNWLPIKKDAFTLTLRTYLPKPELLALDWKPPVVRRLEKK